MSIEAVELSNRARRLAKAKGLHEHADDFAQEAYISLSKGRKAQLRPLLVDFMRDTFGDNRYPNSMKHRVEYHGNAPDSQVTESMAEDSMQWDSMLNLLDAKDRTLVVLKYQWGLTEKEIGYALGVSEGRISQRLKDIYVMIKKRTK